MGSLVRHYKNIQNNYIIAIGTGPGYEEITEEEYNVILSTIQNCPAAPKNKGYHLKADLTWEEYDLPPQPEPSDEDEISDMEALDILLGGTVE